MLLMITILISTVPDPAQNSTSYPASDARIDTVLKIPGRRYYTLLGIIPEDRYFTPMRMCMRMSMSMSKLTKLPSKLTKLTKLPPNQNKRFKQRKEISMNKQTKKK